MVTIREATPGDGTMGSGPWDYPIGVNRNEAKRSGNVAL